MFKNETVVTAQGVVDTQRTRNQFKTLNDNATVVVSKSKEDKFGDVCTTIAMIAGVITVAALATVWCAAWIKFAYWLITQIVG